MIFFMAFFQPAHVHLHKSSLSDTSEQWNKYFVATTNAAIVPSRTWNIFLCLFLIHEELPMVQCPLRVNRRHLCGVPLLFLGWYRFWPSTTRAYPGIFPRWSRGNYGEAQEDGPTLPTLPPTLLPPHCLKQRCTSSAHPPAQATPHTLLLSH